MSLSELIKIDGIILFTYNDNLYVYLDKEVKKKNKKLQRFHNVAIIRDNEVLTINNGDARYEVSSYYKTLK